MGRMIWEAHAGLFPAPGSGWEAVRAYHQAGFSHVSLNIGFDLLDRDHALATARDWAGRIAASDWAALSGSVAEVRAAGAQGKLSLAFDLEGAVTLGDDAGMVEVFHGLGLRQMLLAYNRSNAAAGGCHDLDQGLTAYGRQVVGELNRLGVLVDGAHAGDRSLLELLDCSTSPVLVSHAGCAALHPHGRNIGDGVIRAVAAQGGLVGICGIGLFLGGEPTGARIADHLDHAAGLVGTGHLALGLDWFTPQAAPGGAEVDAVIAAHPEFWPLNQGYGGRIEIAAPSVVGDLGPELERRGWTEADLTAVLGGNMLQLAGEVWQ